MMSATRRARQRGATDVQEFDREVRRLGLVEREAPKGVFRRFVLERDPDGRSYDVGIESYTTALERFRAEIGV